MTIPNQRKTYVMLCEKDDQYEILHIGANGGEPNPSTIQDPQTHQLPNARWWFRFPEQFITSKNKKWIEVHHVKISWADGQGQHITNDCVLHADFVKRDAYLDHTVMVCNETRTKYKKYEYTSPEQYFSIWFTSFANPGYKFDFSTTRFIIELMLIY